jgi:hypothetical protein
MTTLDRALERVQYYTFDGHSTRLAIHKAAEDTGATVEEITGELSRRRAAARSAREARKAYRSTVPSWQKDY